ncbi:hypothetical protein MGSAQ_003369, partial [marine sediment metagenome]
YINPIPTPAKLKNGASVRF